MTVSVDFADEQCKELLMDCESWAETSANAERCGNISHAITDCQQAIGWLQLVYCISN